VSRYNVECALVFIPVYKPPLRALERIWGDHLFLPYPNGRSKSKNRDKLIGYTSVLAAVFTLALIYPHARNQACDLIIRSCLLPAVMEIVFLLFVFFA
jgi:hypothetical protein